MPFEHAPNRPSHTLPFISPDGRLTEYAYQVFDQMWRQVAASYGIIPCTASGTNAITLTPTMHKEGAVPYIDHLAYSFEAVGTATGAVTLGVGDNGLLKAYVSNGGTQANSGDTVDGRQYLATYLSSLDGGSGGFVLR